MLFKHGKLFLINVEQTFDKKLYGDAFESVDSHIPLISQVEKLGCFILPSSRSTPIPSITIMMMSRHLSTSTHLSLIYCAHLDHFAFNMLFESQFTVEILIFSFRVL